MRPPFWIGRCVAESSAARLEEVNALKRGAVVIGYLQAYARPDLVRTLKDRGITSFAMELVPRISRAQSMDALSSQASVAGY